jgi:tetratricopeptide (TPR) repeat protein
MGDLQANARAALERGDLAAAANAARELVHGEPSNPAGYFLMGVVAGEAGQVAKSVPMIHAAIERGEKAEHWAHLAKMLILLRREGEAAEAAQKALALAPGDAMTCDTIGCVLVRLGDHEGALEPFRSAVAARPDNLEFRYNLAAALGFTGRVEEAREQYEHILADDPGDARSHYALAILSRQAKDRNHIPRLQAALATTERPDDALRIRYALAKELEDIGDATAFSHLSAANEQQKRALNYDFAQDAAIFDALEALFGAAPPQDRAGLAGPNPIFVIGMPRTGTTLVDRILSSHPDVCSAGELQAMPLALKRLAGTASRTIIDPETIAASAGIDPAALGEAYLAQASHHVSDAGKRFIDKLPANFLYAGHIAQALPDAAIVCLRRGPMDTVWSNYKNLFASNSAYYAYSYDLMDIARYYARFDRLMQMWEHLFPGRVLQLSYEGLVADQEGQTRRLLDHCGLGWDAACLSFHENSAAVATPSAAQVRRPINADGIGKWRAHEQAMEPVRSWFETQGIRTA